MKADFHSLQMPMEKFGVLWSMKPPFRRALHCGRQRVFKVSATLQDHLSADRSSFCWFYEKPYKLYIFQQLNSLTSVPALILRVFAFGPSLP